MKLRQNQVRTRGRYKMVIKGSEVIYRMKKQENKKTKLNAYTKGMSRKDLI